MNSTPAVLALALFAGTAQAAELPGKALYETTCLVCHGDDGKGAMPGVSDLTDARAVLAQPDAVLLKRIVEGYQSPGSPMAMPPKGGNPKLTEKDVVELLRYMRATFKP